MLTNKETLEVLEKALEVYQKEISFGSTPRGLCYAIDQGLLEVIGYPHDYDIYSNKEMIPEFLEVCKEFGGETSWTMYWSKINTAPRIWVLKKLIEIYKKKCEE